MHTPLGEFSLDLVQVPRECVEIQSQFLNTGRNVAVAHLALHFHNHLVLQAGAYQNGTWVVGVAKAGCEEDCDLIGGSCIVAPTGEIVAQAKTLEDELVIYRCDLDRCREIQDNIFNFAEHREPENYRLIVETRGIVR